MTVRVGIVGWGDIARCHARALDSAGAQLRGVVSRSGAAPDQVESFDSLTAMLPHVDAVTIAVPNHLHAPLCLTAIQAGCAVLVEKPLAISRPQLDALEPVLLAAEMPVHVGFRLRFNPGLTDLRATIDNPDRIECTYELGIDALAAGKNWTLQMGQTGGTFFTLGVHMLDIARWLQDMDGAPLRALRASADGRAPSVDYPLRTRVAGTTGRGAWLEAVADCRPGRPYRIVIAVHGRNGATPVSVELDESSETVEYEAMMRYFVEATARRYVDRGDVLELLQSHRELLRARDLAAGSGPGITLQGNDASVV
jgi:predicted dehydrogenase